LKVQLKPRAVGAFAFIAGCLFAAAAFPQGDAKKGEYLARAGGCVGCHTDPSAGAAPYAGGRALETEFGIFYGPNITPHAQAGIGSWREHDFMRAMREGVRPDGAHYYPTFPYPSFTGITDADLRDLWAFLRSLPPNAKANRAHQLGMLYRWRILLYPWKWLFFRPGPFQPDPGKPAAINRGAYLVHALGHCGECHTPRNFLGGLKRDRNLAGGKLPEGKVPNLTPTELKRWNDVQLRQFLRTGATPDGETASDVMYEVVRNTTSQLTAPDLDALVAYLRSLPALPNEPK
jgi:mono/diheme cytochrome c family protein